MKKWFFVIYLSCCAAVAQVRDSSEESLFLLESTWKNQRSESVHLKNFSGHPTLITMAFTSCRSACPLMVQDMKSLGASLPAARAKDLRFALVSIDPERDTPAVLQAFAKKMNLDERWTLLTGGAKDVRELASVLGFQYKASKTEGFGHSMTIYLLDRQGRIRFRSEDSNRDRRQFQSTLKEEMRKKTGRD